MPSLSGARLIVPVLLLWSGTDDAVRASIAPVAIDPGLAAELRLESEDATVLVRTAPFGLTVRDRDGRDVVTSAAGGALAWATGSVSYERIVSPGYTRFGAKLAPWHEGLRVARARPSPGAIDLVLVEGEAQAAPAVHARIRLAGGTVRFEAQLPSPRPAPRAWSMAFVSPADEGFLGLGERFDRTDQRGERVFSWVEEGGIGKGEGQRAGPANPYPSGAAMTYYPVPFFVSTRGYGFWLDTTYRSEMDLAAARPDVWRAWHVGPTLAAEIFVPRAHDARPWTYQIIDAFTAATGRPMTPPPWAFGPRRRVDFRAQVGGRSELVAMRDADLAVTAIDDARHFLPHGSHLGHEPELAAWTAEARALGYRVNAYFNTMVSRDPKAPTAAFAAEGVARHAFLARPDGAFPDVWAMTGHHLRSMYVVDLTSPDATAWYVRAFDAAFTLGYSGFMYDFGEYVLPEVRAADGTSGEALHNLYPVLEARAAHDALERGPHAGDWLAFMRSGYTGASAFVPMVWSGDPAASFEDADGLPSVVRAGINLGVSGAPFWGSDIGGYHCLADGARAADEELLVRWIEAAALTPNMQDQDACEGGDARLKASIWTSEAAQAAWRHYARLHTRLFPYWMTLAQAAHASGTPILRHMFLEHPEVAALRGVDDAFYAGDAFLVAPVVARGARTRKVPLPDDVYLGWESRRIVRGGGAAEATLEAPLDELPLLLRAGHIVALLDASIDTLVATDAPGVVDATDVADVYDAVVLLVPGGAARTTLFDGTELTATWSGERRDAPSGMHLVVEAAPGARIAQHGVVLENRGTRRIRWDVTLAPLPPAN